MSPVIEMIVAAWCRENDVDPKTLEVDVEGSALLMRGFSRIANARIGKLKLHVQSN